MILYGLIVGLIAAFKWHKLRRCYEANPNESVAALFQKEPVKISATVVIFSIIAVVGIVTTIYGIISTRGTGTNLDKWTSYTTPGGTVSVLIPEEEVTTDNSVYGMVIYQSENTKAYVAVSRVDDMVIPNLTEEEIRAGLDDMIGSIPDTSTQTIGQPDSGSFGATPYAQIASYSEDQGIITSYWIFPSDTSLYLVTLAFYGDPDDSDSIQTIQQFAGAIQVHN